MIRWTDQPTPIVLQPVDVFLERLAVQAAVAVGARLQAEGIVIALAENARAEAERHVAGLPIEQGGLLIGEAFVRGPADAAIALVFVRASLPSDGNAANAVSLRMGTGVWSRAQAALRPGERVVGWFHSHPGLGASFSETDRSTQASFFNQSFNLGWVIDPWRRTEAWFLGVRATQASPHAVVALAEGQGSSQG